LTCGAGRVESVWAKGCLEWAWCKVQAEWARVGVPYIYGSKMSQFS